MSFCVNCDFEIKEILPFQFLGKIGRDLFSIGHKALTPIVFLDKDNAQNKLLRNYADLWGVSIPVAESILHKKKMVENARLQREHQQNQAWQKRINEQAQQFAELIDPRKESYAETCERMKEAIGARIESAVFHAACKIVRFKYSDAQKINL